MDIHNIRQLLRAKTIYDLPLRVTFYARVSSESDEQLNFPGQSDWLLRGLHQEKSCLDLCPGLYRRGHIRRFHQAPGGF